MKKEQSSFFKRKIVKPLLGFLKQGISPTKLALTVAFGAIVGTFPILGTNTAICIGLALIFKLNQGAIQLVNYGMYPIQLALIIPFIQLGMWILGEDAVDYTFDEIWTILKEDQLEAFKTLGIVLWAGVLGWFLFAIPVFFGALFGLKPIFQKMIKGEDKK